MSIRCTFIQPPKLQGYYWLVRPRLDSVILYADKDTFTTMYHHKNEFWNDWSELWQEEELNEECHLEPINEP